MRAPLSFLTGLIAPALALAAVGPAQAAEEPAAPDPDAVCLAAIQSNFYVVRSLCIGVPEEMRADEHNGRIAEAYYSGALASRYPDRTMFEPVIEAAVRHLAALPREERSRQSDACTDRALRQAIGPYGVPDQLLQRLTRD